MLALAGAWGCKTTYSDEVGRRLVDGSGRPGPVIPSPRQVDRSVRSSYYRYFGELDGKELDRVMVAAEEYHQQLLRARFGQRSKWPTLNDYVNVIILKDAHGFARRVAGALDAVVDADAAVVPSRKEIVVLHQGGGGKLFRKLFRAQARLFFLQFAPELPLWLHEGMVSYFEEVEISAVGGASYLRIAGRSAGKLVQVKELLEAGKLPGMAEITQSKKLTETEKLAAWAFVYWSQASRKNKVALSGYLAAIRKKGYEKVKIEKHLRMELAQFDRRWKAWLVKKATELSKPERKVSGGRKR